ncbi:class I SAM-dependent methyltransferase [Niveispirillum cyanobacteriorum]|uniref:Uncharacterized protein n=1 Tax=Niveispirillum cyanobacteriorum TaxID=1612173 RepID=A0A2K9NMT8_9PROT|nr:class I SAM-dependent methyltransferase [Niveispirillum cyanobacteriorum]AUN33916.1 hypothetical protein C0V82_26260 [Niveispirillum cyanobacteriorum]GGE86012.1 hypothetical protein GCM10011317_48960 [Niveispirillum cyanobacteriorum]
MTSENKGTADMSLSVRQALFTQINSLPHNCGGLSPDAIGIWQLLLETQKRENIRGDMLEIGVLEGAAAAMMVTGLNPGEQLVGIDIALQRHAIENCVTKVDPQGLSKLSLHEGDSRQMWRTGMLDAWRGRCRFLHIDGEHSYDAVRSDLELCEQLMTGDGIIAVDDVLSAESVCVTHALFDHLRDRPHRLRMFLCGTNKAYLCCPSQLGFYREICLNELIPFVEEMTKVKLRLSKNSHAWELDYLTVANRGDGSRYMRIGKYLDEKPL